jgi:hypothetical protein
MLPQPRVPGCPLAWQTPATMSSSSSLGHGSRSTPPLWAYQAASKFRPLSLPDIRVIACAQAQCRRGRRTRPGGGLVSSDSENLNSVKHLNLTRDSSSCLSRPCICLILASVTAGGPAGSESLAARLNLAESDPGRTPPGVPLSRHPVTFGIAGPGPVPAACANRPDCPSRFNESQQPRSRHGDNGAQHPGLARATDRHDVADSPAGLGRDHGPGPPARP